ncbi:LysR family transcriptional regulator [Mycobacterium sp. GA-2829]|uniref:LysR family transcriptional regulator n=1 Tax=Mycobacterium sp. GA-2829 TaxID=1772283 RepID=UPI00073FEEC3|nr:LysR family transcriptional regulator [Mycobacterium sp. GA-2829]KUI25862.1 LysR family transcriptional regulator [Mycobacterium sp. GA-2829]
MATADLDLRKLRYFIAVAEELNFGRAAARLHIAQPVLSRQIRALEAELGVTLLNRDSRGATLTPAGSRLLDGARFLLAEARALQQRLVHTDILPVVVRVAVLPGLLATAAARAFEAGDPMRRVEIMPVTWNEQAEVVRRGDAHVVYARSPFELFELATVPLLEEPRDVIVSADDPLVVRESVSLVDLASRRLLQNPESVPEWYAVASPALRREAVRSSVSGVEQKLELVAARAGFAVLPRSTTASYRRPDVRVIPCADLGPSRVVLAWDATVSNPARDEFIAAALACAHQTLDPRGEVLPNSR